MLNACFDPRLVTFSLLFPAESENAGCVLLHTSRKVSTVCLLLSVKSFKQILSIAGALKELPPPPISECLPVTK